MKNDPHPSFLVWRIEDPEDDAGVFEALDERQAAEKWAEDDDASSAEYRIVGGRSEPDVYVRRLPDGVTQRFTVTGEAVPHYRARVT